MNSDCAEELKFEEGVVARIEYDRDPVNPLEDCDLEPTLHLFHSRYTLGNSPFKDPDGLREHMRDCACRSVLALLGEAERDLRLAQAVWEHMLEEEHDLINGPFHDLYYNTDDFGSREDILALYQSEEVEENERRRQLMEAARDVVLKNAKEYADEYLDEDFDHESLLTDEERAKPPEFQTHFFYPVYAYIHGGITISMGEFSCRWDSGQLGYAEVSRDLMREWGGECTEERARSGALACVETYDQYLTGDVYGVVVTCEDPEIDELVRAGMEASCWGFFGLDCAREEARSMAEHLVRRVKKYKEEVAVCDHAI